MSKSLTRPLIAIALLASAAQGHTALSLSNTRVVLQTQSSASVEVLNGSDVRYGMQAWVEDSQGKDPGKALAVTPTLSAIEPGKSTVLRLLSFTAPADKEQIYFLNVQEIPPKPKDNTHSQISLAVRTKIKVLVRPAALFDQRRGAEKQITVTRTPQGLVFHNPTPYYFAVTTLSAGGKDYTRTPLGTFAPNATVNIALNPVPSQVKLRYLEDTGASKTSTYRVK